MRLGQQGLGLADFQIRADTAVPAGGDQVERRLAALGGVAGYGEALIEVLEVDVGGGDGGDQRRLHAVALVFGREELGAGRLVAAFDAAPKIDFPTQQAGQGVGFGLAGASGCHLVAVDRPVIRGCAGAAVECREPCGAGNGGLGAGLFDAVGGSHHVRVVADCPGNQLPQRGIGEHAVP